MDENDYIDRVLSGDTEAYRYFLRQYQDMAFNLAVSIVKDDQFAEEVVQDAFMKAFRNLKSFHRTAKFSSWLYRIIVNEAFQRLKKMKRELPIVEVDQVADTYQDHSDGNQEIQIQQALKAMPSKEGLALNLFYLEERSLLEVTKITGWSLSNTKVILHRARKQIRKLLGVKMH